MQFNDQSEVDVNEVDVSGEPVSRTEFDALRRDVDDLRSRQSESDSTTVDDTFGGLTVTEFVSELADAVYGKGVRPVRPGQFDAEQK